MVFMGKGRGRGGNQFVSKSSGIISATTRKEKRPAENYEKEERDRSRSPMSKRPVLERLGPQREEMSPSHESLRITVGNDIYKERQSRSPLSERLGPPVKGQFDEMKYHTDERYDELYGGEAEPKQGHHRRDRYDNPHSPRSHDRVGRSDSYDRKKSDSYDHGKRSDSYDREWKSSSYDRSRRSSSRDRGRRDHDRNRRDSYDRHGERDKRDGNKDSRGYLDDHDRGISHSERHLSDLDGGFPRQEDNLLQSEQVKRYQESSFSGGYTSLAGSGETKPLKSILKKSAPDPPAYTSDKAAPTFPSEMHPNRPLSYEPPKAGAPIMRSAKKTSSKSFSGLPGMSSYMDIEDEERFLYGDDSEEKYKKESKSYYEDKEHDSYRSENRQSSYKNDDGPPQIETYSGGYQAGDRYQSEELSDYPRTSEIPQQQPRRDSTDLLSIFTSHRGQTIPTVTAPYSTQQNTLPTEEKKAKYDPTIENILKSIGFDFEMSKRMQEKANPVPSKPKEEIQYGIDQASSFLGGELAEDIKKEIFPVKSRKESMVDVLLREAKLTSSPASKQKTSIPTLDRRDSTTKRERSYERESSYQDDASVPSQPTSVASSQPISPSYTPSSSYAAAVTYPVSTVPTTYGLTSTAASSYPPSSSYQAPGFTTYAPPTPYSGPPPYGMPPPGHPSMWGPPPGHPAYATRFMAPSPYGPPPGYPPGYPPYGPPPTSGTSVDTPKLKDNVTKPKMYSNLKSVELSKKVDDAPSKKTETKTVTVVKKTSKKTDSKGKSKGNVANLTTKSSNRTVLPPKNRTPVKSPAEKTMTTIVKNDKDKLIITKVILTSKEKEKLVKEKEQTQQRLKILEQELSSLRKQQNELMRKRRRQKDGHKDPILMQNSILQEEITKQIAKLRQEVDEKAKLISEASVEDAGSSTPKRSRELSSSRQSPTVSASPAKKPRTEKSSNDRRRSSDRRQNERPRDKSRTETDRKKDEASIKDREKRDDRRSSSAARQATEKPKEKTAVETQTSNIEGTPNQTEKDTFKPIKPERKVRYEFFDPGNHWCRTCNVVCSSLTSMLQHLHGKKHQGLVNKYDRPWMPEELKSGVPNEKPISKDDLKVEVTPIKGQEFFMATRGYYCTLCKEHTGDDISAEHHIKTESHYLKYQDYLKENPFYEQRLNLDKAAGISLLKDEEKKHEKKENKQQETLPKTEEKTKEKDPAVEAKKQEQKKKMQAIWDKHIKSKQNQSQNKNGQVEEEKEKEKGKIQINILNKTGIKPKPVQPQAKKNPVLPPWTPVSKDKNTPPKEEPARKPSVDNQEPLSLDDFITIGQNEKIPIVTERNQNLVTADSLLKRVAEKREENKVVEDSKEGKNINQEEKTDLEMLAINPQEAVPVAEVKPPPPPSQNLSLPTEYKSKMASSNSDEMYTLFFSDDKQIIVSTNENQTLESKANDLVEIDAEANVTVLSEDEEDNNTTKVIKVDQEPVPIDQATASDIVVISLDSQSEESDNAEDSKEAAATNVYNQAEVKTEVVSIDREETDIEKNDKTEDGTKQDSETTEIIDINVTTSKNIETVDTVEPNTILDELSLDIPVSTNSTAEGTVLAEGDTSSEVTQVSPIIGNRTGGKNVTEVSLAEEGNPIEVVGVHKVETHSENVIEVVQTRRSSTRIQQQSQKATATTLRGRELSNLHDVVNVDAEVTDNENKSTETVTVTTTDKKKGTNVLSSKKRSTRKTSTGRKKGRSERVKYVPKNHPQVDIVSISDDDDKYENVDSVSDFSADEQELENISSSSEKFETDRTEDLENVSSDSEIEDDRNAELENISSDEMEGNIMTVDEVGEVDEFADFDFNDDENVVDQVGGSDDDMEVQDTNNGENTEKMELENISDTEECDFKKVDSDTTLSKTKIVLPTAVEIAKEAENDLKDVSTVVGQTSEKTNEHDPVIKESVVNSETYNSESTIVNNKDTESKPEASNFESTILNNNDTESKPEKSNPESTILNNKDTESKPEKSNPVSTILNNQETKATSIDSSVKEVTNEDIQLDTSKTETSFLNDVSQPEDLPVRTTRASRRGRGRGRGSTGTTPRRGRSSTKVQSEISKIVKQGEDGVNPEAATGEKTEDVMEVDQKKSPTGKNSNEEKLIQSETNTDVERDVETVTGISTDVTMVMDDNYSHEMDSNNSLIKEDNMSETQKCVGSKNEMESEVMETDLQAGQAGEDMTIQQNENGAVEKPQVTNDVEKSSEYPEVIDLDSEEDISVEVLNVGSITVEEKVEIPKELTLTDSSVCDSGLLLEGKNETSKIETKSAPKNNESVKNSLDDNVESVMARGSSTAEEPDTEDDILPLEMGDFLGFADSSDTEDENKIKNLENSLKEMGNVNYQEEKNDHNVNSVTHVSSNDGDVISISDEDSRTDSQDINQKTPVCVELHMDTIETFNLSMKPEISVSIEPSLNSNKNSIDSHFVDLNFDNIERLQIFQDEGTSNSDNASTNSDIKIDVVLEAIDSLSGVDMLSNRIPEPPPKIVEHTSKSDIKPVFCISGEINEENVEQAISTFIAESKQDEEDLPFLSKHVLEATSGTSKTIETEDVRNDNENSQDNKDVVVSSIQEDEDENDNVSVTSGISMDMGSDFEVLDECE